VVSPSQTLPSTHTPNRGDIDTNAGMKLVQASQIAAFILQTDDSGGVFRLGLTSELTSKSGRSSESVTATAAPTQGGAVLVKTVTAKAGPGAPARRG
jgi:hypothetical protein